MTLNLNKGGLGMRTLSQLDACIQVSVGLRLTGSKRNIEAVSRVVARSDRLVDIGIQFTQIETANQSVIDEFVDQYSVPQNNPKP